MSDPKESKLSAGAKSWTPNAAAKEFVPGASITPAATNNNTQKHSNQQQHQMRMNTNAASWSPNSPQMQGGYANPSHFVFPSPMFQQVVYADHSMMYAQGFHQAQGGMYSNVVMPNIYGNNKHAQGGNYHNNHHNKKNNSNNNNTSGSNSATSGDNKPKNKPEDKGKDKEKEKEKESDEPNITFGDLDDAVDEKPVSTAASTTTSTPAATTITSTPAAATTISPPATTTTTPTTTAAASSTASSKTEEVKTVPSTDEKVNETSTQKPVEAVPATKDTVKEETTKPSKEAETNPSTGWKRNVEMVEKTAAQMLIRTDGITRYGKSQLCSLNTWNKTCPEDIKAMYLDLAKIERPPMCETTRAKSPSNNNRQNNNGGKHHNKNSKNQLSEEPHPDEKSIFSSEHLKSSTLFGGGRPDKVVDTTSNASIVSQANFILNVMTIETFDKMSDKFMKVGLDTEELMKIGVDLIVSKAQLEEHFSFMYADLCKKITDQWVTTNGEEGALGKQFRGLLLNRCQEEFEQDRELAIQAVLDMKLDKDDEDEKLLILKKRYTGHMRFVGEIYMKDMLKANKMHYCIGELMDSADENGVPDNEKLACLCKLFQTIGKKLEDYELKKKRTKVQEYFDRIAVMANDKRLSSKVRFGFKDLIEMRQNNWTARRVEEKAKKLSEIRKDDHSGSSQSTPRSSNSTPRNGNSFGNKGGFQDVRLGRGGSQDARGSPSGEAPAVDEWTVATNTKNKKGNRGGFSSSSSTPTASSGNSNINKFSALNLKRVSGGGGGSNKNSPTTSSSNSNVFGKKLTPGKTTKDLKVETASTAKEKTDASADSNASLLPGHDGEVDANTVKRIIAAFNEYYGNDLIDEIVDVLKELVHEKGMWKTVHATMRSVMDLSASIRAKYSELLPLLYERKVLTREQAVKGISSFLHEFDDYVMDVPLIAGYFSTILAHLFVKDAFEGDVRFITTLPDENDFSISMRVMSVIVQTAVTIKELSDEEKAKNFFQSAVDVENMDGMQKEQLEEAVEKYSGQFLQQA